MVFLPEVESGYGFLLCLGNRCLIRLGDKKMAGAVEFESTLNLVRSESDYPVAETPKMAREEEVESSYIQLCTNRLEGAANTLA